MPARGDARPPLPEIQVETARTDRHLASLDRLAFELARAPTSTLSHNATALLDAAFGIDTWDGRGAALIAAVPPFDDIYLEHSRAALRATAGRCAPLSVHREVVAALAREARASRDPVLASRSHDIRGWLYYREGRYADAAREHLAAATREPWTVERLGQRLNAAGALLEIPDLVAAAGLAHRVRRIAHTLRAENLETYARWLERTAHYRLGTRRLRPSHALCETAGGLGRNLLEAQICMTEAAIAWRGGQTAVARELATRAFGRWRARGESLGALLALGLAAACGAELDPRDVADTLRAARKCTVPGVGIQVLALAALGGIKTRASAATIARLAATVPRRRWSHRLDVLSVDESLRAHAAARSTARPAKRT